MVLNSTRLQIVMVLGTKMNLKLDFKFRRRSTCHPLACRLGYKNSEGKMLEKAGLVLTGKILSIEKIKVEIEKETKPLLREDSSFGHSLPH